MDPFFHTGLSISDSLKTVRKSVLIYETIIMYDLVGSFINPDYGRWRRIYINGRNPFIYDYVRSPARLVISVGLK